MRVALGGAGDNVHGEPVGDARAMGEWRVLWR